MSLTINTNTAAVNAAFNLAKNNQSLHKSLNRLSSGKRITKPADDAGGLAVSMKLSSSITRSQAAISNIQNALSFTEVQDGVLQASARIVDRMAELKSLSTDVMKSSQDVGNYNTEFEACRCNYMPLRSKNSMVWVCLLLRLQWYSNHFWHYNAYRKYFHFRRRECWIGCQSTQSTVTRCINLQLHKSKPNR